jgi:hypothetical protein
MRHIKTSVEISVFAKALAHSDDGSQSEFLNVFAQELKVGCKDPFLSETQPCYISDNLDSNGIDFIKSIYEFLKLREDTKPK